MVISSDVEIDVGLFDLCRAFLAAGTVDDLVEIAPRVIENSLGRPATYQVVLVDPVNLHASPPEIGALHQVCVPMRHNNRLVGAIVIDGGPDGISPCSVTDRTLA